MRIAAVVHGYPPTETAGVELVAQEQADALAARGHDVAVFARAFAPAEPEGTVRDETVAGIPVRRVVSNLGPRPSFRELEDTHLFDAAFRDFLDRHRPDVVHVQHAILLSPNLLRVARDAGCATVLSLHDAFYLCHRIFLLDRDGRRCPGPEHGARCVACLADVASAADARHRFDFMARALDLADAIVAPSDALARRYADAMPFLGGRIVTVDPGIRALRAQPAAAPPPHRGDDGRVRFVFIGTWLPHKGLDLLVDALARLDPARWCLEVLGAGVRGHEEYVAALRERTRDLPVRWTGAFAPEALPEVLARSRVLVLPSRCDESYSRVVREARTAGLAVVAPATGGPGEALRDDVDALLIEPDSQRALEHALARLIGEPGLVARLGAAPAAYPSIAQGVARLEEVFTHAVQQASVRARPDGALPRVTVAYITKNGAPWLDGSLRAVRAQRGSFQLLEVIAVDSGSTDATLDVLARHDVRTLRISPAEFGHGRTRNVAARAARGDIVVFLTQDAEPADEHWLAPLVSALMDDPMLAGVWSRHAPRPGCHPMERRTLVEFPLFQDLADDAPPVVSSARGNDDYARNPERYYWFSNNSSAFRRAVLLAWPFPEVEFAEDQAWARRVLEAGFRTALVPSSLILHSHAYSAWRNLQRNFDHARAMRQELGQEDSLTLGDALRAALRETRRDVAFWAGFRRRTRLRVAARWGASAFAYHLGAFGGRWLGRHAAHLPGGVLERLSLQERVRAGH